MAHKCYANSWSLVAEKVKAAVTFIALAVKNSQKLMTWWVLKSAEAKLSKILLFSYPLG